MARHGPLAAAALLLLATHAQAADPLPYTAALAPTGDAALDTALRDSASLLRLRETAPVGPVALITRARSDQARLEAALGSFGHYAGQVQITIDGRPLDDPSLPDRLEAAAGPVPVAVGITPGPVFTLRRVDVTGPGADEARRYLAQSPGDLAPGAPARAADVLAAQTRMLDALRSNGHALARVPAPVATLDTAARALDVQYAIDAGPRVNLGAISIDGAPGVDRAFVRRRLLIHENEPFDPAKIERARQDLAQLGVFSTVRLDAPDALDATGRLPIAVELAERKRHVVGATAAFSTDLGGSLGVTFQHRNLFGAAEQLNLGAAVTQLGGSAARGIGYDVNASLVKPDLFIRNLTGTLSAQGIKESLDAYDRTAALLGGRLAYALSERWSLSAGLQAQQSQITQERVTRDYTLLGLPLGVRYDSTGPQGLFDPVQGYKASLTATPTASLGSGRSFTRLEATASTYINLGEPGRSVVALRGTLGSIQGASVFQVPPDQRLYAGGSGTVRGYKYQSVGPRFPSGRPTGGTSLAAATVELRQRFGESYGAVLFVDAAQVDTASSPGTGALRTGVGIGARYYTAIGPIRLDVALPLNKQRRDDAFEAYIGIGQAF